jgi:hypothetical protein
MAWDCREVLLSSYMRSNEVILEDKGCEEGRARSEDERL